MVYIEGSDAFSSPILIVEVWMAKARDLGNNIGLRILQGTWAISFEGRISQGNGWHTSRHVNTVELLLENREVVDMGENDNSFCSSQVLNQVKIFPKEMTVRVT